MRRKSRSIIRVITFSIISSLVLVGCGSTESAGELVAQGCKGWIFENKPDDFSRSISLFRQASNLDQQFRELVKSAIAYRDYFKVLEMNNGSREYQYQNALKLSEARIVMESYCDWN